MSKSIKKYSFSQDKPQQIEVISLLELMLKHKKMLTQPHRTNFYHIFFFDKCTPTHTVDFNPIKINGKSLLFINKNCVHFFDTAKRYKGKVIIFTDEFFCKTENDNSYLYSSILFNDLILFSLIQLKNNQAEFDELFLKIEEELNQKPDTHQYDLLKNYLQNIMLLAERPVVFVLNMVIPLSRFCNLKKCAWKL